MQEELLENESSSDSSIERKKKSGIFGEIIYLYSIDKEKNYRDKIIPSIPLKAIIKIIWPTALLVYVNFYITLFVFPGIEVAC